MATRYVRQYSLKDSLTDKQVAEFWKASLNELMPAIGKVKGVQSVRTFSGAGALRADITAVIDMDDASVYEAMLRDPAVIKAIGAFYGAIDLKTSTQKFVREVTPDLLKALSS
jgi:hypothetical protein